MGSNTFEELLDRAAALCGIEPEYWDIFGRYHATTAAGKQAILRAMGWAAGSAEELEQSLAAHTRREWERLAPATMVALEDDAVRTARCSLPAESSGRTGDGHGAVAKTARRKRFQCHVGERCRRPARLIWTAEPGCAARARLPVELPLGYHEIAVKCGAAKSTTRYIVAPAPGVERNRNWRAADARRASPSAFTDCARRATGAAAISAICWT